MVSKYKKIKMLLIWKSKRLMLINWIKFLSNFLFLIICKNPILILIIKNNLKNLY
jgi:hypothetical protein